MQQSGLAQLRVFSRTCPACGLAGISALQQFLSYRSLRCRLCGREFKMSGALASLSVTTTYTVGLLGIFGAVMTLQVWPFLVAMAVALLVDVWVVNVAMRRWRMAERKSDRLR